MSDLETILLNLRLGDFLVSRHAKERMASRGVNRLDIQNLGDTCYRHIQQSDGKWLLTGEDLDGEVLRAVIAYDGDTVVVTVMG